MTPELAIQVVINELKRATSKNGKFNSAHEGYAILLEEVDELWDEIKWNHAYQIDAAEEAKQVAAMAIRYLIDFGKDDWYYADGSKAQQEDREVESV